MRKHLNLGDIKPDEVKEETVKAVAEVLKNAATLKLSEDGQFLALLTHSFLFCIK
jgi:lupus La protein